jgi:glycosyltransferase involved in cell wall biosynthesis
MRIAIATVYQEIGGSTIVLLAAADALREEHEVIVRAPLARADSCTPRAVDARSLASSWHKLAIIPDLCCAFVQEAKWLSASRPDIVYVHDNLSLYVYGLLAPFFGAKVVWHVHLPSAGMFGWLRAALAHHVIQISEHARGGGRAIVIRNAVRDFGVRRQPVPGRLTMAGSICARKNQLLAVETLAALRSLGFDGRLLLCGTVLEEGYLAELRRRAAELNVADRLEFAGVVAPAEYLASAACLFMTSLHENQPLALLEAIVARVPVVATDIAAHAELVELGCLDRQAICPATPEQFAAAVLVQLKGADTLESRARRARELFSQDRFAREIRDYFRHLDLDRAAVTT